MDTSETTNRASLKTAGASPMRRLVAALIPAALLAASRTLPAQTDLSALTTNIYRWRNSVHQDNALSIVWAPGSSQAAAAGYSLLAWQGRLIRPGTAPIPDTQPLHIWYSSSREDYTSQSDANWIGGPGQTRSPDYSWVRAQGYVFDQPLAGTLPLCQWYNPSAEDNLSTTEPYWYLPAAGARAGYNPVRVQGYIYPALASHSPDDPGLFGYDRMRSDDGVAAVGSRPLLIILCEYSDTRFRAPHTPAYYDEMFFGSGERSIARYFTYDSLGWFTWNRAGILSIRVTDNPGTPVDESTMSYALSDVNLHRRRMIQLAAAAGFDFRIYDLDGDGRVRTSELGVVIIGSDPPGDNGGQTRPGGAIAVSGTVVDVNSSAVAQGAGFATMAHELAHQLGQEDIYGNPSKNFQYSLAAGTAIGEDFHRYFHHDAWH